ncbi:hypothetical protein MBLNU459_g7825t2 [Dothideomycetes sp. NU459]
MQSFPTLFNLERLANFCPSDGHEWIELKTSRNQSRKLEYTEGPLKHAELGPWIDSLERTVQAERLQELDQQGQSLHLLMCNEPHGRFRRGSDPAGYNLTLSRSTTEAVTRAFRVPEGFINILSLAGAVATEFIVPTGNGIFAILGGIGLSVVVDSKTNNIYALALETRARRDVERRAAVYEIEVMLGLHWSTETFKERRLDALDFDSITHRLSALSSSLSWDECALSVLLQMQVIVLSAHDRSLKTNSVTVAVPEQDLVRARLGFVGDLLLGLLARQKCSRERAHIPLQTVYSFIAQRDNETNLRTAQASHRIAEASQRDSAMMRDISEDSKQVALRTWRDSTDMRMMAVVNLFTLPGTFTATLFSTSFFNFQAAPGSDVISGWVWLYWAVAAALTILFGGAWYVMSWVADRQSTHLLPNRGHLDESNIDDMSDDSRKAAPSVELRVSREPPGIKLPSARQDTDGLGSVAGGNHNDVLVKTRIGTWRDPDADGLCPTCASHTDE